jgi:long-chain acyl-CoA synthetase
MDTSKFSTVPEVLVGAFKAYSDNAAFTCMGKTLSFSDVDRLSMQFAAYLQNHTSLKPGDAVAVQLPNIFQYPIVMYGILRAGMMLVNTNPMYTGREVKHQLNDSGAKALVVLSNIADTAAEIISETSVEHVIVTDVGDLLGFPKGPIVNFVAKSVKKLIPEFSYPNQVSFKSVMSLGASSNYTPVQVTADDVAVLQYTGGTTGVAKGAMLTHGNLVQAMNQVSERMGDYVKDGCEVFIAPLPLYHVYAFTTHCMMLFAKGGLSILIPNPGDKASVVSAVKPYKLTGFVGLNTLFNSLCNYQPFTELDFSQLKITSSGGMALTSDVSELWKKTTGCDISEGFGMTETTSVVSTNPMDAIQVGTVGTPIIHTEVKVVDGEGKTLPNGESGELLVRGPQVMKGYWQRPEATAETISEDGWLDTGDMAVIQDDGYIRIVDRKKDMIIVSGFNVYPNEIEEQVSKHPGILECAVIGVKDAKTGEAIKLFAVKSDDSVTEADIIAFARKQLTAYKVPRQIEFRSDLPKSNVGKILRRELKDEELAKQA